MRRSPRSRASASNDPPDPYTTALAWLGRRELSEAQVRVRLARRGCEPDAIESAVARLKADRAIDDVRAAGAAARLEAAIRRRGPARVRQRLHAMGLDARTVQQAVADTFARVDESTLLDEALARRLRGSSPGDLDPKARARLVRSLVGQGFSLGDVLKRVGS